MAPDQVPPDNFPNTLANCAIRQYARGMTTSPETHSARVASIIKWHAGAEGAAKGITNEFVLVPRRDLPSLRYESLTGDYRGTALAGATRSTTREEALRYAHAWFALSEHLPTLPVQDPEGAADIAARRNAVAGSLTIDYLGGPHPYALVSRGIQRATDQIITLEDQVAA